VVQRPRIPGRRTSALLSVGMLLASLSLAFLTAGSTGAAPVAAGPDPSMGLLHHARGPFVCDLPRRDAILHEGRTRRWLTNSMEGVPGRPDIVDVNGAFCTARTCKSLTSGVYTYSDDLHLSATRVFTLRNRWLPVFRNPRR
jgi:hypothetical protein